MEDSPFARLSAELRNQIWSYALYQPDGFYLDLQKGRYQLFCKRREIALTKTCRQINTETTLLLYNINKFTFFVISESTVRFDLPCVEDWLRVIGPAKASVIAEICFDLGHLLHVPWENWYKKSLRQVFGAIRKALMPLCKSLPALTVAVDLEIRLDEDEYQKCLSLELPLIDEPEAIRRVEDSFNIEKNRVMQRLEFDGEESDLVDPEMLKAWAADVADDDCAALDRWKNALLCVIKEA
ncbi:hypothetical protein KC351_g18135 [Hortaea werneckii]|nr:hypothetical protein KC351_g18135 [Hortaea werneckii]